MEYISSKDVKPFDFGGLKIRELTPRDLSEGRSLKLRWLRAVATKGPGQTKAAK